jgi:YVTN family beta-propeller protein
VIGRYDPGSNRVDWVLGTGQGGTHMVEVSKDEKQIYTANIASDSITIIDAAGIANWNNTVIGVGKGPEGFDITPDGKQLWAANSRDGSVSVIDLYTKRVVSTFGVQTKRSNRLKFSPDGRLVLISDLEAGDLLILEHATKKELKRIKLGRQPAGILITPDSSRAYIAVTGDDNVAVIDLKTLEVADRLKTGRGPDGMAWIP